jgi:hypothetical protein
VRPCQGRSRGFKSRFPLQRRHSQEVRQRSAKPLFSSSNLDAASSYFRYLALIFLPVEKPLVHVNIKVNIVTDILPQGSNPPGPPSGGVRAGSWFYGRLVYPASWLKNSLKLMLSSQWPTIRLQRRKPVGVKLGETGLRNHSLTKLAAKSRFTLSS